MRQTFICVVTILATVPLLAQGSKMWPEVPYEPSPDKVVQAMLALANVHKADVVYDLGCGDGRIVIAAARQFGARGVGIDIDPARIQESRQNARSASIASRVSFRQEDLFSTDLKDATVVIFFLSDAVNLRLRPKLLRELRPGARLVSYVWDMGDDWKPDRRIEVDGNPIYLWIIPANK